MFKLNPISVTKQPLPAQDEKRELTLADLGAAAGGAGKTSGSKLFAHCCSGTHIPEVTIEL